MSSNFTNLTNLTQWLEVSNNLTDGYLVFGLEVTVLLVLFLSTLSFGKWKALTYSSFVTGIMVFFLNLGGLADYWHLMLLSALFIAGVFMTMQSKSTYGE